MVVSDDTVTRFLEGWTDNRVPIDKIQDAFRHTPAVSDAQFYDLLRDELLAQQLVTTFVPSIEIGGQPIATPSQRWDWFNRVNRMAVIEAVPLAVADYEQGRRETDGRGTDEVLRGQQGRDCQPRVAQARLQTPAEGGHRVLQSRHRQVRRDRDRRGGAKAVRKEQGRLRQVFQDSSGPTAGQAGSREGRRQCQESNRGKAGGKGDQERSEGKDARRNVEDRQKKRRRREGRDVKGIAEGSESRKSRTRPRTPRVLRPRTGRRRSCSRRCSRSRKSRPTSQNRRRH